MRSSFHLEDRGLPVQWLGGEGMAARGRGANDQAERWGPVRLRPPTASALAWNGGVVVLLTGPSKVGQIAFHPAASSLLASASGDHLVRLWDIEQPSDATLTLKGHKDSIQSLSWNAVGTTIVTTCRDKKLRLFDPRAGAEAVRMADGHSGIKGSRAVWLGDRDRIATTGVSAALPGHEAGADAGSLARCRSASWVCGTPAL